MTLIGGTLLKRVDRWAARAALPVGWTLARLPGQPPVSERPLVVRPGGMGDLICLCLALEDLGHDPTSCTWLIEQRSRPWAEYLDLDFVCYDADLPGALARIRGRYRTVINTEQRFGLAQAAALAATAPGGRLTCFATTRGARWAHVAVPYDRDRGREVDELRRLLATALSLSDPGPPGARVRRRPVSGAPLVAVAGRQSPTRSLDRATWARLIRPWAGERDFLVAAAPIDSAFAADLVAAFPDQARQFDGSFADLCDAVAASAEVFTMDGGMVHVASYHGVPVTAVFTSGQERKWAPLAPGSAMIRRADLSCQPCARFGQTPPCTQGLVCQRLDYATHRRAL